MEHRPTKRGKQSTRCITNFNLTANSPLPSFSNQTDPLLFSCLGAHAKFIQKLLGYVKSEILDATTTILLFMVEKSLALAHDMVPKLLKSNCQASSVDLVVSLNRMVSCFQVKIIWLLVLSMKVPDRVAG